MNRSLRKLRGVISIGLIWGILWAAVFAAITIVVWVIDPEDIDAGEGPVRVGAMREIALARAAIWGLMASAVFPLLTGRQDQVFVLAPIGAALAVAAVAIARKAESRDPREGKRSFDVISGYDIEGARMRSSALRVAPGVMSSSYPIAPLLAWRPVAQPRSRGVNRLPAGFDMPPHARRV